jgi:hypothetical protein
VRINYGVNRIVRDHGKRKKTEHRNGTIEIFGVRYGDQKAHEKIRKMILEANPGWAITGYARQTP